MKNIKHFYKKHNKGIKRVVSGFAAVLMLFNSIPVSDMIPFDNIVFSEITANAADETYTFSYSDSSEKKISLYVNASYDSEGNITNNFQEYAHRYQTDSTFASDHKDDKISIAFTGANSDVLISGFEGIGTSSCPFEGSVEIPTGSNLVLNLDAPLFSVVYDTAKLYGSSDMDYARISRFYRSGTDKTTSIIATEIRQKPGSTVDEKGFFNVSLVPCTDGDQVYLKEFGGFIGTVGDSAVVTVNAEMTKNNSEVDPEVFISSKDSDNIGLCCKTMGDGSTLNFTVTGDRVIKYVSAESGNAGGLAGSIGTGSILNYTQQSRTTPFIKSGASISTSGSYAGGLVGENKGTVNIVMPIENTVTVGDGEDTVDKNIQTRYVIDQNISANTAAGGLYGYYSPASDTLEIETAIYDIDCDLTASEAAGGLAGIMESNQDVSIVRDTDYTNDYIQSEYVSGTGNYGGLIGKYKSLHESKIIKADISGVRTHMAATNIVSSYGGVIGLADETNPHYIKVSGFTLENAGKTDGYVAANSDAGTPGAEVCFGGLVGTGKRSFIDASGITVKAGTSSSREFRGGAVVGDLGDGVLRLSGSIDLSNTKCKIGGQIVGKRDDALVFSENTLSLTRGTTAVKFDDIGSWGEMLRFTAGTNTTNNNGTSDDTSDDYITRTESLSSNTVLTVNETAHTIVIGTPVLSIATSADFAKTALCFQIETGGTTGNPFVSFETNTYNYSNIKTQSLSLASSIGNDGLDLSGTGLTGLTRDNDESNDSTAGGKIDLDKCPKCVFEGAFNGNSKKLKLAVGDTSTGFNGKIYTHNLNGLFGIANNAQINSVTLDGVINIDENASYVYAGAGAARSTGTFDSTGVTVLTVSDVTKNVKGHTLVIGRLLGEATSSSGNITVSTGVFSGNVTGHNADDGETSPVIGGVIGCISQKGAFTAGFNTVTSSGTLKNASSKKYQQIGGLIANIEDASGDTVTRTVNLTSVNPDGLTVEGTVPDGGCQGGFLGYQWKRTDVNVNSVTVGSNNLSTVKMTGAGNTAGLIYRATGHWDVKNLVFTDVKIDASTAKSVGMMVNIGKDGSNGIYMDLRDGWVYTVTSADLSNIPNSAVFDELVAYSADSGKIMTNGQGIVSIHVAGSTNGGLTMDGTSSSATASGSYTPRTARGATPNPNTRYYYNLDTITNSSNTAAIFTSGDKKDVNKLMSWAVHKYAASNIQSYFASSFTGFSDTSMGVAETDYDLQGYSWYPLDVGTMTVNGNYTLYNSEFEYSEAANGSTGYYARTSLYDTTTIPNSDPAKAWNSYTQHYLMQNALFNNVTGTLTVGNVSLAGNVGIAKAGEGSGALVFGKFEGASDTNHASLVVSTSLILNGIKIHNFDSTNTTTEYAPLIINKVTQNTDLYPEHIWATGSAYTSGDVTSKAATSLIGKVGGDSAEHIVVSFKDIRLDGRNGSTPNLDDVYNTKNSIFTKATLLESLAFKPASGSSADYTFRYSEDWNGDAHIGNVTYGAEISDSTTRKEFYNQEFYYFGETGVNKHAINPESKNNPSTIPYDFSGFLPYIYKSYQGNYHQGEINHAPSEFGGCGTYNHPYTLTSAADFVTIQKILSGELPDGQKIKIDTLTSKSDATTTNRWCNSKTECVEYTYDATPVTNNNKTYTYFVNGTNKIELSVVQNYVASAYYSITVNNIELGTGFLGLGYLKSGTGNQSVFHGVINGNGNTLINKSGYPLIKSSYGSTVYNLNIQVDGAVTVASPSGGKKTFETIDGCDTYGAVIGRVFGGDNIIDDVFVTFTDNGAITMPSSNYQISPVGGYIGVVINGGVIFRGYEDNRGASNIVGLATDSTTDKNYTNVKDSSGGAISSTSKKWLYINPIIGRVLNGYAFTEADHFRPFDDGKRKYSDGSEEYLVERTISNGEGVDPTVTYPVISKDDYNEDTDVIQPVTMRNGTKNYSIADLDKNDAYIGEKEGSFAMNGTISGSNITLSSAQALHIMSMITKCGLGKSSNGKYNQTNPGTGKYLKPYDSYMSTHLGNYRYVGNAALTNASAPTSSTATTDAEKDYINATGDVYSGSGENKIPYMIKQYTPKVSNVYPAFNAAGNSSGIYYNLILSGDEDTFYVPDGYRGLGALLFGDTTDKTDEHTMYLYSLNGNHKNVSLNMELYVYHKDNDNYTTASFNQAYFKTGFGFINNLISNYNNDSSRKFKNLTLKGNVQYEVIDYSTGKHVDYTGASNGSGNIGSSYYPNPAVAAFVGAPIEGGGSMYCENISLDSMEISGMRNTGGFVGAINVNGTYYFVGCSADDLKIFSGGPAGGLVGYMRNRDAKIYADFQNKTFGIISVVSASNNNDIGQACKAAAGGLIGDRETGMSKDFPTPNANITVKNVQLCNGTSISAGGYIGYYNDGLTTGSKSNPKVPSAGGVVGDANISSIIEIDNVTVKNLNICGAYSGGMVGRLSNSGKTYTNSMSKVTVTNSSVLSDTTPKCRIECPYDNDDGASGGFIGSNLGNAASTIDNCILSGYTISGDRNVGGLVGLQNYNVAITTKNIKITGHTLKANSYAGGLIGKLNNGELDGYNILINNQSSAKYSGSGDISNYGYIVGYNNSKVIKIAGFSRQGTIDKDRMVGNKAETASPYGTNGYVIFADFDGNAAKSAGYNVVPSSVNVGNSTDVTMRTGTITITETTVETNGKLTSRTVTTAGPTYSDSPTYPEPTEPQVTEESTTAGNVVTTVKTTVIKFNENRPYVTVNPKVNLDKTASPDFLTSDGVSETAFYNILSNTSNKNYTFAKTAVNSVSTSYTSTSRTDNPILVALKTSNQELGNSSQIESFPMLVIESTKKGETTKLINSYLRLLTNTSFDFYNEENGKLGTVYNIDLVKMKFDKDTTHKFEEISKNHNKSSVDNCCLKWEGTGSTATFGMDANDVDSSATQFSLIDVQFLDPTGSGKVVYHVYAPVLVKRVLRFNFTAKTDSGTNYDISHYTNQMKNSYIFENLGTPVTIEFEYDYLRNAKDWENAINSGESSLTNYYKQLYIKSHYEVNGSYNVWPTGTKLVLVDPNNKDKFYYLDDPATKIALDSTTGVGTLNLYDFVVEGGDPADPNAHYKPVDFCDLMTVTVTQNSAGTLTDLGEGGTGSVAYEDAVAKSVNGSTVTYYRAIGESESIDTNHKFKATVSGEVSAEKYYLSIFTKETTDSNVYRYEIKSVDDLAQTLSGKWSIPNKKWIANRISTNGYCQYFTGHIYENDFAVTNGLEVSTPNGSQIMGQNNNLSLNVKMTATVILTDVAKTKGIAQHMYDAQTQNAHLYQSFLISLDMLKESGASPKIGIQTKPAKSDALGSHYFYSEGASYDSNNKKPVESPYVDDTSKSFIELQNGQDLLPILANNGSVEGGNGNAVSIHAEYDLIYGVDQIPSQFPKGIFADDGITVTNGTKVIAYSNVASSIAGTAYSSNSKKKEDSQFYYSESSSAAVLNYHSDEEPYLDYDEQTTAYNQNVGPYSMLGINPLDDDNTEMYVSTYAIYDASLLNKNPMPGYLELKISLSNKANGYGLEHKLPIADYISNLNVYGIGNDGLQVLLNEETYLASLSEGGDNTTLVVRVPTSSLQKPVADVDSYRIPITFIVKTGTPFETANHWYSNYMVTLEAEMYDSATASAPVSLSETSDHIIYTNAKIKPVFIDAAG